MQKIDFNVELKEFDGEGILDTRIGPDGAAYAVRDEQGNKKYLTLKLVSVRSLMFTQKGEDISGEDKLKRDDLASKIYDSEEALELTSEQITLIKNQINKTYTYPRVVSQSWRLLDPPVVKDDNKVKEDQDDATDKKKKK